MRAESRDWFDRVYDFTEGIFFPFGFSTGHVTLDDIDRVTCRQFSKEELKKTLKIFKNFREHLPPEADFLEEKQRILPEVSAELRRRIPSAKHAVYFGRPVGDIDIGLIGNVSEIVTQIDNLVSDGDFARRYAIIDFNSMYYFASENYLHFVKRLIDSRKEATGEKRLPTYEKEYILQTIRESLDIW